MMEEKKGPISEWYRGRSIFVTGGTGFMGKVLVEKLLYATNVKCIYILMRAKRGRTPEQRIEDMWQLPMFERLRKKSPNAKKKIVAMNGDLYTDNLGLKQSDIDLIHEEVSVVFHCAATLKLEAKLKDALEQNTGGTRRVIDICRPIKNLKAFVHFSTAFCSADIEVFEEKVYDCPDNPRDVLEVANWIKPEALEAATPYIIAPHPNTYTYSKRLAEKLVADEKDNMPVIIIRPSIVCPSGLEPLPGWVDSLNGPMGLLAGASKGVIRSMHCKGENRAQVIPCDMAIGATIIAAQKLGSSQEKPKEVPVYNMTQDEAIRMTWKEVLDLGRSIIYDYPFEMQVWYPDGDMRSSRFVHLLCCFFFHWIPAFLIDGLMFLLRQKRFMVRIQRKIQDGLDLLEFFTVREWIFRSSNFLSLFDYVTDADRDDYPLDWNLISIQEYMKICILGCRQYCLKEDLSSLPRCRIQQKFMYLIHKLAVYGFYYYMFCLLLKYSTVARSFYDPIGSYLQDIPVVGYLAPK